MARLLLLGVLMVAGALLGSSTVQASPPTIQDLMGTLKAEGKPTNYDSYGNGQNKLELCEASIENCISPYLSFNLVPSITYQTNYDCCDHQAPLGSFSGLSIGNCVWQGMPTVATYELDPVNENEGVALSPTLSRFGKIFATCQLNSGIDKCGGPDCANLKLSLQGDIYATIARSHQDFVHTLGSGGGSATTSSGNSCCDLAAYYKFGVNPCDCTSGDCDLFCESCCDCGRKTAGDTANAKRQAGSVCDCCDTCRASGSNTTAPGPQNDLREGLRAHKSKQGASKQKSSTRRHHTANGDDVYVGLARIAIGTAVIVDDHSGHTRVESAGTFNAVLDWNTEFSVPEDVTYNESELHWIRPGTFELMWREEEQAGYKAT